MFRHPNVIAALILTAGMLASAILIGVFVHSLDQTIASKSFGGANVSFPRELRLYTDSSSFHVSVDNYRVGPDVFPFVVQPKK